jgi:hypothetical protein
MKAIYATIGSANFIEVANEIYEQHGIYPCYWVTDSSIKEEVKDTFENTVVHDSSDAMRGILPEEYDDVPQNYDLDAETISDFREYEMIAIQMMERIEIPENTKIKLPYDDRVELYYQQLSYWIRIAHEIEPDIVIFGNTPHLIYDYILYSVCLVLDIKTIMFTKTGLPNRFFVRNRLSENPIKPEESKNTIKSIPNDIEDHIDGIQKEYSEGMPDYMRQHVEDLNNKPSIGSSIREIGKSANRFLKSTSAGDISKMITGDSLFTNRVLTKVRSEIHRYKLQKEYAKHVENPEYSINYIYFPLHYQPEETTSPRGGRYVHQHLAVDLISSVLPETYRIFIKEHPSQFSSQLRGERGRSLQYYERLCSIPEVDFVPVDTNPFKLIDNSEMVATITGTAGWEALLRGTPASVFGDAWYQNAPGCYHIKDKQHLYDCVHNPHEKVRTEEIKSYISNIIDNLYFGSLGEETEECKESLLQAMNNSI